jgi:hypothetical protein
VEEKRYTLTLPEELYTELTNQAKRRGATVKDLVRQSLKLGLLAIKLEDNPNTGLFLKEQMPDSDSIRETRLLLV